jgi:hypothetical protein
VREPIAKLESVSVRHYAPLAKVAGAAVYALASPYGTVEERLQNVGVHWRDPPFHHPAVVLRQVGAGDHATRNARSVALPPARCGSFAHVGPATPGYWWCLAPLGG